MKKIMMIFTVLLMSILLTSCDLTLLNNRTYEIIFDTNGGTEINHIYVDSSFTAENLEYYKTTYEGYVFGGWFIDETLLTPVEFPISSTTILYAKWQQIFTITWLNDDDSVITTTEVLEGELPVYDGVTPTKAYDGSYTYTFDSWTPALEAATADVSYKATFTQVLDESAFDNEAFNLLFDFNISDYLPAIYTHDYVLTSDSNDQEASVNVIINDWTSTTYEAYLSSLDDLLQYNDENNTWVLGQYTIDPAILYGSGSYVIQIHGLIDSTYTDFSSIVNYLNTAFNYSTFLTILPTMTNLSNIGIFEDVDGVNVSAFTENYNTQQAIDNYKLALTNNGWYYDSVLSTNTGFMTYAYDVSDVLSYAIYLDYSQTQVMFVIFDVDRTPSVNTLNTFSNDTTITIWEEDSFGKSGLPSIGSYHVLLIPVEIKGSPFPADYLTQLELTFNGTAATTGWESVSSFYTESSYGKLNLTFDIQTKYITNYDKAYYEGFGTDGDQYAIKEALLAKDPVIDYSQYDYNNDGVLDSVYFIYSVQYNYDIEPWWAWVYDASFGEADSINDIDGKSLEYYMWASYYFSLDDIGTNVLQANAETYIHETGHLLGFIDLYPYETYTFGPVGGFDMMDWNAGDHGPANKVLFGWQEPLIGVTGTYDVTLDSYATDTDGINSSLIIPYRSSDLTDGDAFDEFVIIMFYTPQGLYEGHLSLDYVPDSAGIVIYHVDARTYSRATFWGYYFEYNNEGLSDFFIEVLEADKNDTFPSTRYRDSFAVSDMLTSGTLDLSTTYYWHQGGAIDIQLSVLTPITNTSASVTFNITVG